MRAIACRSCVLWLLTAIAPAAGFGQVSRESMGADPSLTATQLGWPPLAGGPDTAGLTRELRAWVIGGIFLHNAVVRLMEEGGRLRGERLLFWDRPTSADSPRVRRFVADGDRMALESARRDFGCARVLTRPHHRACELWPPRERDWLAVAGYVDSVGGWSFVDHADLPRECAGGVDGATIIIEVRVGAQYFRYSCWSPSSQSSDPSVRRMAGMWAVLWGER